MSTTTPTLGLTLYDSTTDQVVTFATFRAVWGGTASTSNFYKIDTWAGTVNSSISTLQNQRGAITVSATYISANYYEATVASITSYTTGMNILLKLDTDSAGTVTLNISSLGTKSVTKVNSSGAIVNIAAGELQSGRYYLFTYDGTQWVWANANSSDQIYVLSYVTGNVLTAASDGSIDGTLTQSLLLSQTINSATAKTTLADSDNLGITDSAASNVLKKITWANFKTAIGTALGAIINALTGKTTPVGADTIVIGDSGSSYASKQVLLSNLYKSLGTGTQDSTTYLRGDGTYATVTSGAGVDGWVSISATLTYSSADSPTFVISSNTDLTSILSVGMKIWFQNSSTDVFAFITAIGTWSGSAQLITLYCGTDYTVANSAITAPYYSTSKSPKGFPIRRDKWTQTTTSTSNVTQSSPTSTTWYNVTSLSIPIGAWDVYYNCSLYGIRPTSTAFGEYVTLSTANNSEADKIWTSWGLMGGASGSISMAIPASKSNPLFLSSKTSYYLNMMTDNSSVTSIAVRGDVTTTIIRATISYL